MDIDLAGLRAFHTVLREGSYSAAALVLKVPKSTLSKRVADLENSLNVRLLDRTTRALRPTAEGLALAPRAEALLADAADLARSVTAAGQDMGGHLRLAVPSLMGHLLLGGLAAAFRTQYPDITLEVLFQDHAPDLLGQGLDAAITFGPLSDSGQVGRLILHGQAALVASPGLAGIGALRHPDDLTGLPMVGLATPTRAIWLDMVGPDEATHRLTQRPALALGSGLAQRDAVLAGAGFALMPLLLAEPDLDAGRMVRLLPEWAGKRRSLYLIHPSGRMVPARLRALIDFVIPALRALRPSDTP